MSFQELKEKSFEEADVKKLITFLNLIHNKIDNLSGAEAFEYFALRQWAERTLLTKMKAHVLGEPKIYTDTEE